MGKKKQEVTKVHVNKYAKKAENRGPKPADMEALHPGWMDEQCKKAVEQRDGKSGIRPVLDLSRSSGYDFGYSSMPSSYEAPAERRRRIFGF